MKIAVIDNYDSFTYNLVHLIDSINNRQTDVYRNDKVDPEMLAQYNGLVLSPGPGIPDEAGLLKEIIHLYAGKMQAIAEVFGASLINLERVYHGVDSEIVRDEKVHRIFEEIPQKFMAGRYHSWIVAKESLPSSMEVIARDTNGDIMGLSHKEFDICGVQFHPESVLTPMGARIMSNWIGLEYKPDKE